MFPQLFGKYVLEREIAAGGMGRVYLATLRGADGFEKRLVVKQIRAELATDAAFVRRFVDEAKVAVELNHPNILPVYELGVEQGIYYLAMELCEGKTIAELVAAEGALTPAEGAYVGVEICRALDYAHRRVGIVHRDVTPRNVMVDEEGAVRLIDFGIAAKVAGSDEVFGSPGHMPPEQIRGEVLTPAADVFAVGALLIEVWTSKPPFRRETVRASLAALEVPPPLLHQNVPQLGPLSDLVLSAVARSPADRPADAEQLARPLREFLRHEDLGDVARRLGERVRRQRRAVDRSSADAVPEVGATPQAPLGTPPAPEIHSHTFAARQDLVEWTRRLSPSSAPPPASAPATRRLPQSSAPPPPGDSAPPAARARPAKPALVLGLSVGLLAAALGASFWAGTTSPEGLASPAPALARGDDGAKPPPAARRVVTPAVVSAPALAQDTSEDARAPRPAAPARSPVSPARPPAAPAVSGADAGAPAAPERSSLTAESERAALRLSSDLQAVATVGSQTYGNLPALLQLDPGRYDVSFHSNALGERLVTTVVLGAGDRRALHADFTSPSPRVILR